MYAYMHLIDCILWAAYIFTNKKNQMCTNYWINTNIYKDIWYLSFSLSNIQVNQRLFFVLQVYFFFCFLFALIWMFCFIFILPFYYHRKIYWDSAKWIQHFFFECSRFDEKFYILEYFLTCLQYLLLFRNVEELGATPSNYLLTMRQGCSLSKNVKKCTTCRLVTCLIYNLRNAY